MQFSTNSPAASSALEFHPSISGLQNRSSVSQQEPPTGAAEDLKECKKDGQSVPPLEAEGSTRFICNICLNSPDKPVATVCGHMYCWKCLYKWLDMHRNDPQCPVCKAGIEMPGGDPSKAKVVPLYVSEKDTDPRQTIPEDPSIPQRPPGERPEPQRSAPFGQQGWQGGFGPGGFGISHQFGNINVTAGFGLFPSLFGMAFSPTWPQPSPAGRGPGQGLADGHDAARQGGAAGGLGQELGEQEQTQQAQQEFLARLLFMIGTFIAVCLIFFP
mmetsp:Transcript_39608/g.79396  ORF Transcript_39608/g.79396 Transcript_39608/m.79396 type:complete len:272 (-) Transcript_39608:169-984(-)